MFHYFQKSAFRLKLWKFLLVFLTVFAFFVCSKIPSDAVEENFVSSAQTLSEAIAELAPDGWGVFDKVKIFTAENLYEHIDGRAELYLAYDVQSLTTATLEKKSDTGEYMELSVYDMETPTNAFGIFSVERYQDEISLDIGRESYRSGASIFVWKGKYYTTIVTPGDSEDLLRLSLDLAQKVTALLADSGEPVWGLSVLPKKNRVSGSVKYFKVNALGLDFLPNTYTAVYRKNGNEILAFLAQQDSADSAGNAVARYVEYAAQYGNGSRNIEIDGATFVLCDMDSSFDVIFQKGRLVGGVQSVKDPSLAQGAAAELRAQIALE